MLRRPAGWPMSYFTAGLRVFLGLFGVAVLVAALSSLLTGLDDGQGWLPVVGFGGYFTCYAVAYGPWLARGGEPRQARGGTALPFSALRQAAAAAQPPLLLALAAGLALDRGSRSGGTVPMLLFLAVAGARRLRGRRSLLLTPDVVAYRAGRDRSELRWEHVTDVKPITDGFFTGTPQASYIDVVGRDGGRVRVHTDLLAISPVVAYWTLRHYAAHPEARAELADARAAARITRRELDDGAGRHAAAGLAP